MTESHQRAWNANPDIYSVIENGHCHYKDISAHCNKKSKTIRNKKERFLLSCLAISVNSNQFRHRRSQPVEPRHAPRKAPLPPLLPFRSLGNSEAPSRTPYPQRDYSRALPPRGGEGNPRPPDGGGVPPPKRRAEILVQRTACLQQVDFSHALRKALLRPPRTTQSYCDRVAGSR